MSSLRSWLTGALVAVAAVAGGVGSGTATAAVGTTSLGIEAGLPLVLGLEGTVLATPRVRVGLGIGRLGGLTAVRAEARYLVLAEVEQRFVPSIIAGAEQFFLKDGDKDATPVGIHAALGLDYHFPSAVSVGVRLGALKTFGSSGGENAKVFGVQNNHSSGMFNLGVRYHFF